MGATHPNSGIAANSEIKTKAVIQSWEDCRRFVQENDPDHVEAQLGSNVRVRLLGDGRPEVYEPFQRETGEYDDIYAVVLYETEIVRYYPDGSFSVDNGGYNTPTTSRRATQFTPPGVSCFHKDKILAVYRSGESVVAPATHDVRIKP